MIKFWRMEAHSSKDVLVNCHLKKRLPMLRRPEYLQLRDAGLWFGFFLGRKGTEKSQNKSANNH